MSRYFEYDPRNENVVYQWTPYGGGGGGATPTPTPRAAKLSDSALYQAYWAGLISREEIVAEIGELGTQVLLAKKATSSDRAAIDALKAELAKQSAAAPTPVSLAQGTSTATSPLTEAARLGELEQAGFITPPQSPRVFSPNVERWRALVAKHFPPEAVDNALSIMELESGGNPTIPSGYNRLGTENSWGLFQINLDAHPGMKDIVLDPESNIAYAASLYKDQGWAPWLNAARKLGLASVGTGGDLGAVPPTLEQLNEQRRTKAIEDFQAAMRTQRRPVEITTNDEGRVTSIWAYDPTIEKLVKHTYDSKMGTLKVDRSVKPKLLIREEGVSPAQRALGIASAARQTTRIPLGGPIGETARPEAFSALNFEGKALPLFDLPYLPQPGGGLQSAFRRSLLGGQAGLIPTNVGPEGQVMARGLDAAGNEIGFGTAGLGSDPYAFGTGNRGMPLLRAPTSANDAARRALILQQLQAQLGPERAADPAFYLQAAEQEGLLAPNRGKVTGLWGALDPVERYAASVGLAAAAANATAADRQRYSALLAQPGVWDAQGHQGSPGAQYDIYGRVTYDPTTDTRTGYSGAPPGFALGGAFTVKEPSFVVDRSGRVLARLAEGGSDERVSVKPLQAIKQASRVLSGVNPSRLLMRLQGARV